MAHFGQYYYQVRSQDTLFGIEVPYYDKIAIWSWYWCRWPAVWNTTEAWRGLWLANMFRWEGVRGPTSPGTRWGWSAESALGTTQCRWDILSAKCLGHSDSHMWLELSQTAKKSPTKGTPMAWKTSLVATWKPTKFGLLRTVFTISNNQTSFDISFCPEIEFWLWKTF